MAYTRLDLQTAIYDLMSRDATSYGFCTPDKTQRAMQSALNWIAASMMKLGGGWLTKTVYANITAGSGVVTLPAGLCIINFIKIQDSTTGDYIPINYGDNSEGTTTSTPSGTGGGYAPLWSLQNGGLFLEPAPSSAITNGILINGTFFPTQLAADADNIATGDFDNWCFIEYAKFRAASTLYRLSTNGAACPWDKEEAEWKSLCIAQISRRFREPTAVQSFEG